MLEKNVIYERKKNTLTKLMRRDKRENKNSECEITWRTASRAAITRTSEHVTTRGHCLRMRARRFSMV